MKKSYLSGLLFVGALLLSLAGHAQNVLTINTNPANDTVCAGAAVMFTVSVTDTPSVHTVYYLWQVSNNGGSSWDTARTSNGLGMYTDTLSFTGTAALNGNLYRVIVSDSPNSDTSLAAMLHVDTLFSSPVIGASSVCRGGTTTLSHAQSGGTWSSSTPSIATINSSGILSGIATGFDTVFYSVTNTCGTHVTSAVEHVDTVVTAQPISGPTMTCAGHFITLTNPNVLGTGVWTSSNTAVAVVSGTGVVTGVANGTATITYDFSNACSSGLVSTLTIGVDTGLAAGSISGPTKVCTGSWIHLTASVGGGTWFSSNSALAIVDPAGNVTGVSNGMVTISYFRSNACGASIATYADTVQRPASVIVGLDSVGIGDTRALTDSATGGTWSISIADTGIATIDAAGVVTGVGTGTTTVTYTVTNVCGTTSATMLMHVGPHPAIPAIGGPDTVCLGATITLSNTLTGGVWHSFPDSVATIDSVTGVVSGLMYGTVTIGYTYSNGFGDSTITKTVVVNRPPVVTVTGPSIVSIGNAYQLRGLPFGTGFFGATWSASNSKMGTIVSIDDSVRLVSYAYFFVIHGSPGHDTLTYTIRNTCGTRSAFFVITMDATGVKNTVKEIAQLQTYPNPSHGEFTMSLASATDEEATVTITNILGEKVKELAITTNKKYDIKLTEQPAGVYYINAHTADSRFAGQVTIAK